MTQSTPTDPPVSGGLSRLASDFYELVLSERVFLVLLALGFLLAGSTYQIPAVAAWVGFLFAGYSAVGNDSIQTIGTFIASNRNKPWWILWLFIGGIFLVTVSYSWVVFDGDVSHQRLAAKGFGESPQSFSFLQIAAPLFLLILTRLRMPVSTTFLLLSSFATQASGVADVLHKSVAGYAVAFVVSMALWLTFSKLFGRKFVGQAHPAWRVAQWITSGFLWSVWIQQDAANIAVYLPRSLSWVEFAAFAGIIFFGLGLLFRMGGEKVQEVVDEKSHVVDVRPATIIDLVYAVVLLLFKMYSNVPMSTTWVFIGLLGGRELAMTWRSSTDRTLRAATALLLKDLLSVTIGLVISLVIATAVNDAFRREIFGLILA